MEVWEIYAAAVSEYKAKNFDAALELLEDIKKVAQSLFVGGLHLAG